MASGSSGIKQCILRSRNYKYRDIILPDKTPVVVGRGPQTKIRERKCSKSQIQIIADYKTQTAKVVQFGPNPSQVNDKLLVPQAMEEVMDGASINLIENDLKYTFEFLNEECSISSRHKHHTKHSPEKSSKKQKFSPTSPTRMEMNPVHQNDSVLLSDRETSDCDGENNQLSIMEENKSSSMPEDNVQSKLEEMHKAVVDNFNSLSTEDRWEEYDHSKIFIFTPAGLMGKTKVAAFDMDHTIITTKSGKVFPVDIHDWQILYPDIPGKLKKLHEDGYKTILFTNQKGISRGKTSAPEFKKKVQRIIQKLGVPMQAVVSTGSGRYRKPNTGMWDYFVQKCNQGLPVELSLSFFVGDAAGRPVNWAPKKKKDFSCADRLFALNIGVKFFTPEEYFLGYKPSTYSMPVFDPRNFKSVPLAVKSQPSPVEDLTTDSIVSLSSEVIVFVGFPAAGKSQFAETYLIPKGYVRINRDVLGSWQKCVTECSKALSLQKRVVIDNTNPDLESRGRYIECAKKAKVPCRCFLFVCPVEQARHNNVFRQLMLPDDKHLDVNDMVINSYKSKFKEPNLREGFAEIVKVNFVPKFKTSNEEKQFKRFLLEK